MSLLRTLGRIIHRLTEGRKNPRQEPGPTRRLGRLALEPLEDRLCLSGNLLVSSFFTNSVLDYDGTQGSFLRPFASAGGLASPLGLALGPGGDLFVSGRDSNDILRYDGNSGAFRATFVTPGSGGLSGPHGLVFGPDGNLYVSSGFNSSVLRYDGTSGTFISAFVAPGSGGLGFPHGLTFGPDGNLYVGDRNTSSVLRYDGTTGMFLGAFVPSGNGGLNVTTGLVFGADGNLYVDSFNSNSVLRYDGKTGAFLGTFASGGGLSGPQGLAFGLDGNLYVSSFNTNQVLRYNGATGAFIDVFASGGGLAGPTYLLFQKTHTTTTVNSSANPSVFGQPVIFTATVNSLAATGGTPTGTVTFTIDGLAQGPFPLSNGQATFSTTTLSVGVHTITASYTGDAGFNASSSPSFSQSVAAAALTVTANNATRVYGQANPAFTASYSGFVDGDTVSSLGGALSFSTPATASSPVGTYPITPSGLTSTKYTITFVNGTLTVTPAPLTASGVNIQATAGAPFSGTVATFQNADPFGGVSSYTATITWGDGNSSVGTITDQGGGVFAVSGSNTYADPKSYALSVLIQHKLGYTTPATPGSTATVTSLGIGVQQGQSATIGFWHNFNGQALIISFNGGASATMLANWLATKFPNLYGANAGNHNLTGQTNVQVAAFYLSLFDLSDPKLDAQVLATALNVYATTLSLGGTAARAYGFTVNAYGLGADSVNVGANGAAFDVANSATLNVYELLLAANKKAVRGVLYSGDQTLRNEAVNVFDAINEAGGNS